MSSSHTFIIPVYENMPNDACARPDTNGTSSLDIDVVKVNANPNLRIKLLRRKYDNIYTYEYDEVDLKNYVTNNFANTINPNEYILSTNPIDGLEYNLMMKDSLVSGTYKILVSLYDGDNKIGDTYEYMIIK